MSTIAVRKEVAKVLNRELVGVENSWAIVLVNSGMVNPVDVAREIVTRHVANIKKRIELESAELVEQEKELAFLKTLEA